MSPYVINIRWPYGSQIKGGTTGYVETNLLSGEEIVYKAKIHWVVYLPSIVLVLLSIISGMILAPALLPFAVIFWLVALIYRATTEVAVTSRRVIVKTGIISRKTVELNHTKVESINVDQGIFGRIMNFGTIAINGTGGGKSPINKISKPLEFRKIAMDTVDSTQSSKVA